MGQTTTPASADPHPESRPADAIAASIEAVLLSLDRPVSAARLAAGLGLIRAPQAEPDGVPAVEPELTPAAGVRIRRAVEELNASYAASGRCYRIELVAGGYRIMLLPEHAGTVAAFHAARGSQRLSRPAVETLAVIAYRQPITRAQLEAIRGVSCGEVLRSLVERRLVTITGRAEELGRPLLYGTTRQFLAAFGLASLKDLPAVGELHLA